MTCVKTLSSPARGARCVTGHQSGPVRCLLLPEDLPSVRDRLGL